MKRILSIVILGLVVAGAAFAARSDFPQPRALEPDVTFWKRIYSEVGTDGGLIHDTHDLSLVYEVVKFPSRQGAERHIEARKRYYQAILRTLATGKRSGLSRDEKRVLSMFGGGVTSARLRLASERLRFQLGQADKFRAGIVRSGAYMDHILGVLRDMNLPLEIAHLPHVESSFTPNIYSRVGAAGLWQFTSATGRRFMRVDHVVDERLDPYRASIAAARLLEQNYRVTGTWPLAITSYNHGASGMRRAAQQLGTKDIARIVRNYRSPTFGFASRNFYVEFLAADHVASNYQQYFGELDRHEPIDFESVTLPYYARARDLANAFGVDVATLEKANPALRPGVWRNSNFVPKGYSLRVPSGALGRPIGEALAAVPNANRYASQATSGTYVVRRGDTLSKIASRHGLSTQRLASMNGIRRANSIRVGQRLRVPSRETIAPMAPGISSEVLVAEKAAPAPKREEKEVEVARVEPPKAAPSAPPRPEPVATPSKPAEAERAPEPAVAALATETYTVRRGDNLTRIARAHGTTVAEIAALNRLGSRNSLRPGQRLVLAKPAPSSAEPTGTPPDEVRVAKAEPRPEPVSAVAAKQPPAPRPAPAKQAAAPVRPPAAVASETPRVASAAPAIPADPNPELGEAFDPSDESATDPSPGLLADPSDYSIGNDRTIVVQPNETLGHYAEWLGVRASRLRQLNGMRYSEPVVLHQKLRLDFANVPPADFERIRTEYHRKLQEAFFAEWEIEGTSIHKVGPGDSIWSLSTRRFAVPIWLLRQYNPDVDLDSLSAGTQITVPKLRQRAAETSARDVVGRTSTAG
ncbi:MAG: LysM peptidoglycan-binding domain-containing protein [Deltaproteobacteria bacterium]|nr:LysM peptidoglycan-binding domain-containing protein [Deltaproteobacteria bacterium]